MKEKLINAWNKLNDAIAKWIKGETPQGPKPTNPYRNIPDPNNVFRATLGMNDIHRDSDIPENLKNILIEIEKMGDRLRKLGESDGPYQMFRNVISTITLNTAMRTSAYIETLFKGIQESLNVEKEVKNKELENAKNRVEESKQHLKILRTAKNWVPDNYSQWAWMYLVFGLLLLAADLALSLNVTKLGFGLTELEKWAMSAGITACTIYIKIYYDEYILSSLERSATQFQEENLPKMIVNKKNLNIIYTAWGLRFVIKTALLAFILCTIYILGELRFEIASKVIRGLSSSENTISAFVFLSVLFPIVGGVCMAVAIKRFRSLGELREAKKEYKKALNELFKTQKELSKCEQDRQNCESYIIWSTNNDFIERLKDFLFSCYMHGYEYAFRKHNTNLDILQKAKEIRRLFSGDNARLNG